MHSTAANPLVVGIDILPVDPIPGVTILLGDILEDATLDAMRAALGGAPVDLILSDMAASTVGHRQTDHLRTMRLTEAAVDVAMLMLRPGGGLVAKAFRGGTEHELLAQLKRAFASVRHVKPPASRAESVELYLVAQGFRGAPSAALAHDGDGIGEG